MHYYHPIYKAYLDFTSCPNSVFFFPEPRSKSETYVTFGCHVYSISTTLEHFLRLSLSFKSFFKNVQAFPSVECLSG